MRIRTNTAALAAALALVGCDDGGTGLDVLGLEGTWRATVYEYTDRADAQNRVDVIQRDGASFTLIVTGDGTASTVFDDGLGGTSSDSGTLNSTRTKLTLGGTAFDAQRTGDVLTLVDSSSSFDFGTGSVSATLRVVMNRR